jgi:hypothetical protein
VSNTANRPADPVARQTEPLVFNIIYTPGTVQYLAFFVSSLLKWSDASFRLVSNGCEPEEQRYLKRLCAEDARLEYWAIPTKHMLPHGLALNYLQMLTRTQYFCFMDSDIFATGEFLVRLTARMTEFSAVFSGAPLWMLGDDGILPESFRGVWGEYYSSADGRCLGSTYMAMYDNAALTALMQDTGIGFEGREWDEIPAGTKRQLAALGFENRHFDTGKILILLLQAPRRAMYLDEPALWHIGGTSFQALYEEWEPSPATRIRSSLRRGISQLGASNFVERWSLARTVNAQKKRLPAAEARVISLRRLRQRNPVRIYLFHVLQSLVGGRPLPVRPDTGVTELNTRLDAAARALSSLYLEFTRTGIRHAG